MHCCAARYELRLVHAESLKAKRAAIRPIIDGAHRRFGVAAAEVDDQDDLGRAVLGFAAVASTPRHVDEVLDQVDRFVWSFPEIEVVDVERRWADEP